MVGHLIIHPFYRCKQIMCMLMKFNNIFMMFTFLLIGLMFSGCQEEVVDIIETLDENVLNAQSPLVDLVGQTTQRDGSEDNILDHSSCISIVLPVTVIANGQQVQIGSEEDIKLVERIFDESDTDEDVLTFEFPIKVTLADHSVVTVQNYDQLEDLTEDCLEGGDDDDFECVDFVYPISISIYNSENQVSEVVTVENDEQLYTLFKELDEYDLVGFNFPLELLLKDGTEITIDDNEELEDVIEDLGEGCDEDDDDDYNDDDVDDSDLRTVLLEGEWEITYFFDDTDETSDFNDFRFTFMEENKASAVRGDLLTDGTWNTYGDDGELELELNFGPTSPLDELEDDWTILEFDEHIIKLVDLSDDGTEEFLTFERATDTGGGAADELSPVLISGEWIVAQYLDSGNPETSNYAGFKFNFKEDGTVIAFNDTEEITGTWSVTSETEGDRLVLDFGEVVPFDEFNEDWHVITFNEARVELEDIDEGAGTTDTLVFEKI